MVETAQSDLPPEFEADVYRSNYRELARLNDVQAASHYRERGRAEGRRASRVGRREAFFDLMARTDAILEIGPLDNPCVRGPNVKYFDVLGTEALREKARAHGLNARSCPEIHYVSETGDLCVIDRQFDAVVSSHAIEHQPDLVRHLQGVARILKPGGRYFLAIPDKRYCFDHFNAESTLAEVLGAYVRALRLHDPRCVIRHFTMSTHNDAGRHWCGDHGEPEWKSNPDSIRTALAHVARATGTYVDAHAWQFTPDSFQDLMQGLTHIGLSQFDVERIYPTLSGELEFYAVLRKARQQLGEAERAEIPQDFDDQLYLLANPDVAAAKLDPREHYIQYGRREGRRLRP